MSDSVSFDTGWKQWLLVVSLTASGVVCAQDQQRWTYSPDLLQPFWSSEVMQGESVLFIRDPQTDVATGRLLFPVSKIIADRKSVV